MSNNKHIAFVLVLLLAGCGQPPPVLEQPLDEPRFVFGDPSSPRAIILHQGHHDGDGGWTVQMTRVAERFAAAEFVVYRAHMPPPPHDASTDFLDHLYPLLDTLSIQGKTVFMVGLSGGGWTTTMMTALDPRIAKGYSVAGDLPLDKRIAPQDQGDWEQQNPPLGYYAAYDAAEGRLLHIFNWYDPCCFAGVTGDIGTPYVIDYSHTGHRISDWAAQYILSDINSS